MKKLILGVLICLMLACSTPKTITNTPQETIDSTKTTREISKEEATGYYTVVAVVTFMIVSFMVLSYIFPPTESP